MKVTPQSTVISFLGTLCVNFSEIEDALQWLIGGLISRDATINAIVTSDLSFKARISLLKSLVIYRVSSISVSPQAKDQILNSLDSLSAKLGQMEEKRNSCIHSNWSHITKENSEFDVIRNKLTSRGKGLNKQEVVITKDEFEKIILETVDAMLELMNFDKQLQHSGLSTSVTEGLKIVHAKKLQSKNNKA